MFQTLHFNIIDIDNRGTYEKLKLIIKDYFFCSGVELGGNITKVAGLCLMEDELKFDMLLGKVLMLGCIVDVPKRAELLCSSSFTA